MMDLHANILGEGKPFIILHGFLGMSDNWKTLGRKFSEEGFEVHLLDQRNHGRSFHDDEFNYEALVDDLYNYCRQNVLTDITTESTAPSDDNTFITGQAIAIDGGMTS